MINVSIILGAIIITGSVLVAQDQTESETKFQVYKEKFDDAEWTNEVTKLLPREGELGREWTLMWSDGTDKFSLGQSPIMIKKTIAGNEIFSTSYNYEHFKHGTYQVLIWKGELVSHWVPIDAVENIFSQTDAKIERIIESSDLSSNCVIGYYDYYADNNDVKNDLLFAECAKKDYRIRINLSDGEFNQESIDKVIFLSNITTGKI